MYDHFAKKVTSNKDFMDVLLVVIRRAGWYQVGYDRWELLPKNHQTNWINTKLWSKKECLKVKQLVSSVQKGYGIKAVEEADNDAQYNVSAALFATCHEGAQGSIVNLTATNAVQQQQIAVLFMLVAQSAKNAEQVIYFPPLRQSMM